MVIVLTVAVFLISIVFSLVGLGGGVLYTPIQVWLGIPFHVAATTSLFLIMVLSFSATFVFGKAKKIDWPLAITLVLATVLGGFIGGIVSVRFSGEFLSILFSLFLLGAGYLMIDSWGKKGRDHFQPGGFLSWSRTLNNHSYSIHLGIALPISLFAGLVSGLLGVGGGLIQIPMMVLLFRVPVDIAVGSSAFMIGVTAMGGFCGHYIEGHWDWETSFILAAVVFIGGQIGSRISIRLDEKKLRKISGYLLFAVAGITLFKSIV